jgi:hypothetical protein
MTVAGWDDLPLEVKLKILALLPAAGEEGRREGDEAASQLLSVLCDSNLGSLARRPWCVCMEGVCREWRDLLWQERPHLDLSLRATLRGASSSTSTLWCDLFAIFARDGMRRSKGPVGD